MYELFYGLKAKPFSVVNDTKHYFESNSHKRARVHINFGLQQKDRIMLLTGEPGCGKSSLVNIVLNDFSGKGIENAKFSAKEIHGTNILEKFVSAFQQPTNYASENITIKDLKAFFDLFLSPKKQCVIVIDDADQLTNVQFAKLFAFLSFIKDSPLKLQFLLVGNESLEINFFEARKKVEHHHTCLSFQLHNFSETDTKGYIINQLKLVDWKNDPKIDEVVYTDVYELSQGNAKKIADLIDRLFTQAMLLENHEIHRQDCQNLFSEDLNKLDDKKQTEADVQDYPIVAVEENKSKSAWFSRKNFVTIAVGYATSMLLVFGAFQLWNMSSDNVVQTDRPHIPDIPVRGSGHSKEKEEIPSNQIMAKLEKSEQDTSSLQSMEPNSLTLLTDDMVVKKDADTPEVVNLEPEQPESTPEPTSIASTEVVDNNEVDVFFNTESINNVISEPDADPVRPSDFENSAMLAEIPQNTVDQSPTLAPVNIFAEPDDDGNLSFEQLPEPELNEISLNRLVAQYAVAYQFGDLALLGKLFRDEVRSNDINNKSELETEYKKLFDKTYLRRLTLQDVEWSIVGDELLGEGVFNVSFKERATSQSGKYTGTIVFHVKKENKKYQFTELYYNYEKL